MDKISIAEYVPNFKLIRKILNGDSFKLKDYNQEEGKKITNTIDVLNVLVKYNMSNIVFSFGSKITNGLPPLTHYILAHDDILSNITNENDYRLMKNNNLVKNIIKEEVHELVYPINIPKYNLRHFGMICHFNSCLNLLSSLTGLIGGLNDLYENRKLNNKAELIYRHLINTMSYVDLNPKLAESIIDKLDINPNLINEATETMKKLLKPLYDSGLSLTNTFFWDSSDKFYKSNVLRHTLYDKLVELKPLYFICSVHDFNSTYNIDDYQVNVQDFSVLDKATKKQTYYKLSSVVIFNSGHYTSAFLVGGQEPQDVIIKNDLVPRYEIEKYNYEKIFNKFNQHTIACYYRVN